MIVEKKVREFIQANSGVTQISSDFWPALEVALQSLIRKALRRNGKHTRLTSGELGIGAELRVEEAVKRLEKEENQC